MSDERINWASFEAYVNSDARFDLSLEASDMQGAEDGILGGG